MSNYVIGDRLPRLRRQRVATIAKEALTPLKPPGPHPAPRGWSPTTSSCASATSRYSFAPHYHPYVGELTRRLLTGSTRGLQAVGHRVPHPREGDRGGQAADDDGPVTIAVDEEVFLPDGIGLTVSGEPVRLAGRHIVTADDQPFDGAVGDAVVVPAPVEVDPVQRHHGDPDRRTCRARCSTPARCPRCTDRSSPATRPSSTAVPASDLTPHPVEDLDFTHVGRLRRLQLGAVLPRADADRGHALAQRTLRGGDAVVPLPLRPHRHLRASSAPSATGG